MLIATTQAVLKPACVSKDFDKEGFSQEQCAQVCQVRGPGLPQESWRPAAGVHRLPVARICGGEIQSLLLNSTYVINTFRRRTHSALHWVHPSWICSRSSAEIGGAPARSGSSVSVSFLISRGVSRNSYGEIGTYCRSSLCELRIQCVVGRRRPKFNQF